MKRQSNIFQYLEERGSKRNRVIIFPESDDERIIEAVRIILKKRIAQVILLQKSNELDERFSARKDLTIIDTGFGIQYAGELHKLRRKKNPKYTKSQAESDSVDPLIFSMMLLKNGFANGVIAGSVYTTTDVIRQAISIIGIEKGNKTVSSFFLHSFPRRHIFSSRVFAFADCGVIPSPLKEAPVTKVLRR